MLPTTPEDSASHLRSPPLPPADDEVAAYGPCRVSTTKLLTLNLASLVKCEPRLQKRVLSVINIPPPMRGLLISNAIFRCMKEWGIEKKVFSITVDNASSNDSTIRYMKDTLQRLRSLKLKLQSLKDRSY
nr:zinc finger BED domain-containing protein RICESLEEPER 2-like [Ipomoea batatas]